MIHGSRKYGINGRLFDPFIQADTIAAARLARVPSRRNSEISRKHGNTLVSTRRKFHSPSFAPGVQSEEKLSEMLIDWTASLTKLVENHERGTFKAKVAAA